jgi:hypothetical protein
MNARPWLVGLVVVSAALTVEVVRAAELAPAQREKLVWIDTQLQKTVTLYREKKIDDLKKLLGEIETAIAGVQTEAGGDATIEPVLNTYRSRLAAAQKLSNFVPASVAAAKPIVKKPKPGDPVAGGTSFIKDVVPIIVGKCNNCHVTGNRGDFSMATYQALMLGTAGQYAVIKPGKGETSTIVEKLQSGEMPPGGNKCTDAEIATIIKWINEGAKFDGMDMTASLGSLAPAGTAPTNGPPQVVRATGNEKVQFMRDVAPILMDNCASCHGTVNSGDGASNYSVRSFNQIFRGGQNNNGNQINPGNAEASFIVKMLRGTAIGIDGKTKLRQMPARGGPLDDKDLQTIITWINEGAKFDGESPTESIQFLMDVEKAKKATHEELLAQRREAGKKLWARANPDSPSEVIEAGDFTIIGNLGAVRLQEIAKQADAEKAKLVSALKLPTAGPLVKGRITIMAFDKKFEYTEFGRVGEGRELHPTQLAHWRFNFIDCYGAIVVQPTAEETGPLLSEVITGAYLDSLGSVAPRWFAVGTARNIAAKIHGKSPLVKGWEDAIPPAMSAGLTADAVATTTNLDNNGAALAMGFVKELMKMPAWTVLMSGIAQGKRFDPTFQGAFRTAPTAALKSWMGR